MATKRRTTKAKPVVKPTKTGHITQESILVFGRRGIKLYATEVNLDRAVPDLVDGLKPVQRRNMYGMSSFPNGRLVKGASVVGEVMGKYHPHGDSSIYGSIITMVQAPVPLIYGEGNWGSLVDGAAAMRYTQCRLSKFAELVFDPNYINKEVTSFVPNYDDTTTEPVALPIPLPNILLNGGEGIGVGITCVLPSFTAESIMVMLRRLLDPGPKDAKVVAMDFARTLKPSFQWGGQMVNTKVNRQAWCEMFTGPRATVQFESSLVVDEAAKSIKIDNWPAGLDPDKVVFKVRNMPECQEMQLSEGTMGWTILCKRAYNLTQFQAFVAKVQAATKVTRSFKINVTRRTATINDGVVDYEVALLSMSVPHLLITWLRSRIETEIKSLNYRIAKQNVAIAYSELLIHASSPANLDVMFKALKLKGTDPVAYIAKGMKVTLEEAAQLFELRFRQLSNLDTDQVRAKLKEQQAHLKQLQIWLKKPKPKVLADAETAFLAIQADAAYQKKKDTEVLHSKT